MSPEESNDTDLRAQARFLAKREARGIAEAVRHLLEVDRRRSYAAWGYPSLFAYCVRELRYSEAATYRRVYAARLARRFPSVLGMLERGEHTLESLGLLGPHLSMAAGDATLRRTCRRSLREIKAFLAAMGWPEQPQLAFEGAAAAR